MKTYKLILMMLLLFASQAWSQVGLKKIAQSTMNFQLVSVSPKASAMGEAFCAVGKGAESVFFNPAGVVDTKQRIDVTFSMTQWIGDIDYVAGAVVWNAGLYGSIGLSVLAVDYGTIYSTSLVGPDEKGLYPLGYKDNGPVDNIGAYSFGLTYGRAISSQFFIGGNVRLAGQNLGESIVASGAKENKAHKLVFDAGVEYYTGLKSFRFGMSIRNFSSSLKREEIDEQLPQLFSMGAALDLMDFVISEKNKNQTLTLALDFVHPNNYSERVNVGLEYGLHHRIFFRGGYQGNQDLASWSAGVGMNATIAGNQVQFDYSYSSFDIFDGVTRLAVGLAF